MIADDGLKIKVGDVLESEWGYKVTVYREKDGELCGKLICEPGHSCENIPYSLNNGKGHVHVNT